MLHSPGLAKTLGLVLTYIYIRCIPTAAGRRAEAFEIDISAWRWPHLGLEPGAALAPQLGGRTWGRRTTAKGNAFFCLPDYKVSGTDSILLTYKTPRCLTFPSRFVKQLPPLDLTLDAEALLAEFTTVSPRVRRANKARQHPLKCHPWR